jgi:hypothetical protein
MGETRRRCGVKREDSRWAAVEFGPNWRKNWKFSANFFWNLIQKGFEFKPMFESFQKPKTKNLEFDQGFKSRDFQIPNQGYF